MADPIFNYDEPSDTLYVSFEPGAKGTGIELNDHILLRLNKAAGKIIGLTLLEYSLLAQQTEMGPRSFPLIGLTQLSTDLQEVILDILRTEPVNKLLALVAYTPSIGQTIPTVSVLPISLAIK